MGAFTFIVMGVSGTGKTVLCKALAGALADAAMLDADFLHPRENILKMRAGLALTDRDRQLWLKSICDAIFAMRQNSRIALVGCSALKKAYRDLLRQEFFHSTYFIFLDLSYEILYERLAARTKHFFKKSMLESQFASLEVPLATETNIIHIDASMELADVLSSCKERILAITNDPNT